MSKQSDWSFLDLICVCFGHVMQKREIYVTMNLMGTWRRHCREGRMSRRLRGHLTDSLIHLDKHLSAFECKVCRQATRFWFIFVVCL